MGNDDKPIDSKPYSSVGFFKDNFYIEREDNGKYNYGFSFGSSGSSPNKKGFYYENSFGNDDNGSKAFGYRSSGECIENRKDINDPGCFIF